MIRLLVLSLELSALGFAAEFSDTLVTAQAAFSQGRLADAESAYRYATALDPNHLGAVLDLAVVLRDQGKLEEALPLWVKGSLIAPTDPAVWEGRAWALLQLDRYEEAHEAFKKAVFLSTSGAPAWSVYLGDGLTFARDRERDEGVRRLKSAMLAAPLNSAPLQLIAALSEEQREDTAALTYYRHALTADPGTREAQEGLARMLQDSRQPDAAYQLVSALLRADPGDPTLLKQRDSLAKLIAKRHDSLLPMRKLGWPLVPNALPAPSASNLRIALLADAAGRPAEVSSFTFVSNVPFKVLDSKLGDVVVGRRMEVWRVWFDPSARLVSLRSLRGDESYATRSPVTIVPSERGGDLVLKDFVAPAAPGRDLGDRELRGSLTVEPGGAGLRLSLESAAEDYVRGALAAAVPSAPYAESLKALAVVLRSRALARNAGGGLHPGAGWSHCDSSHCGVFLGVQEEYPLAGEAVEATRGLALSRNGAPVEAVDHEACGGHTQSAEGLGLDAPFLSEAADVKEDATPSPSALDRYSRSLPPEGLLCSAAHPGAGSSVRWTRILDGERLQERLNRMGMKGTLKDLLPGARTPSGRLMELRAVGAKGELTLKGDLELARALSPGSLRSTLFTLTVFKKRDRVDQVVLWGVGTGHGLGLCRFGADGLAAAGKDFRSILKHYFPRADLPAPSKR